MVFSSRVANKVPSCLCLYTVSIFGLYCGPVHTGFLCYMLIKLAEMSISFERIDCDSDYHVVNHSRLTVLIMAL